MWWFQKNGEAKFSFALHSICRDIKEGFIVSGSGTVLNQIDENDSEQTSPQSHSNRGNTQSSLGDVALPDYLKSDDVKLEDVKLREIDSFTMMEAFKEVADIQKLDKETYVRTVAEVLGFSEDQYDEFARATIKNAEDNIEPNDNSCNFKAPTLTRFQSSLFGSHAEDGLGTSQAPTANKETYVRTVAEGLGFSEDQYDEFARVTIKNADDKVGPNDNSCDFKTTTLTRPQSSLFGSHAEDGLGTSQAPTANGTTPSQITINQTVDDIGDSFGEFTAPSTNKTARATGTDVMEKFSDKASLRSILNTSMLNSMTVKDLPDRIRGKLLSILRFQRRNRQKQAAPQKASTNKNWVSFIVNIDNEESNLLDLSFEDLANDMREISVVVNKNKKNSRGFAEGGSRTASASGQRYSVLSSFDSDEEGPSTLRSPSDVLAYKEVIGTQLSENRGYYMPARGYEFYLRVFNSISHSFAARTL